MIYSQRILSDTFEKISDIFRHKKDSLRESIGFAQKITETIESRYLLLATLTWFCFHPLAHSCLTTSYRSTISKHIDLFILEKQALDKTQTHLKMMSVQSDRPTFKNSLMQNIIIFFHGYASSPKAEKFQKLAAHFGERQVFAFAADLDPERAQAEVFANIESIIAIKKQEAQLTAIDSDSIRLILVGSSMGCWLAAKLSVKLGLAYSCSLVLINPCLDPAHVRAQHPEHADLLAKYQAVEPLPQAHYFISRHDEVIDHTQLIEQLVGRDLGNSQISIFEDADHRFNGPEFESVLRYIAQLVA